MTTPVADPSATRIWCDDEKLWIELTDGRVLGTPLGFYPRLMHATPAQRAQVETSGEGTGLHWPDIDEDISAQGMLTGSPARRPEVPA